MCPKKCLIFLLLITLLPLSSCSSQKSLPPLQPQWLVANDLTITEHTQDLSSKQTTVTLQTLTIDGLRDRKVERSINDLLKREAEALLTAPLPAYHGLHQQLPPDAKLKERSVSIRVTGDFNHLLSVSLQRKQTYRMANGQNHLLCIDIRPLTVDLHTGRVMTLADLFPADSDYQTLLNQLTQQAITSSRSYDDIPSYQLIAPFTGVTENWHFNVTPYGLCFYLDEQTPAFLLSSPQPQSITLPNAALDGSGYFAGTAYDAARSPLSKTCHPYRLLRYLSPLDHYIVQKQDDLLPGCYTELRLYLSSAWPPVIQQAITQAAQPDSDMLENIRTELASGKHQCYLGSGSAQRLGPYYLVYGSMHSGETAGWIDIGIEESYRSTQTIYDAQTLQTLSLSDLFVPGYDYQAALIQALLTKEPKVDEATAQILLKNASFMLQENGLQFMISYPDQSWPVSVLITFRELGEDHFLCFQ